MTSIQESSIQDDETTAILVGKDEEVLSVKAKVPSDEKETAFDMLFLKRLFRLIGLSYKYPLRLSSKRQQHKRNVPAILITILLIVILLVQTYVVSYTGQVIGTIYTALSTNDWPMFRSAVGENCIIMAVSSTLDMLVKTLADLLAWAWRRSLVPALQKRYFTGEMFYKVVVLDGKIDNPDIRLTQDIDGFCSSLSASLSQIASGPFIIGFYTYLSWKGIGWFAPLVVFAFFIIGFIFGKLLASSVALRVHKQERLEGDFRFIHSWIRHRAEEIALADGSPREETVADRALVLLLTNKLHVVLWQGALLFLSDIFTYFATPVNYCVLALAVFTFKHPMTIADVSTNSFNCIMLISGWSTFLNASKDLSKLAGFTGRLGSLLEAFNKLEETYKLSKNSDYKKEAVVVSGYQKEESESDGSSTTESSSVVSSVSCGIDDCIKVESLSTMTPEGIILCKCMTFTISPGHNLIITGPSGCGKSTLLKVIHGIWPFYTGSVVRPFFAPQQIQYLPQKPYISRRLPLSAQITYPLDVPDVPQEQLNHMLSLVGLTHLMQREQERDETKTNEEWSDSLSLGEQQRLCILRVLYHRPRFAVLDEATSALDSVWEQKCYSLLAQSGATLISVSHHESIKKFHSLELSLKQDGTWSLNNI